MRFLLRADAGTSIGHGHRTRVEALARSVQRLDGQVRLVSQPLPGGRPDLVDLPGTLWIPNTGDPRVDARLTMRAAEWDGYRPDVVVVDSYTLGSEWEDEVASQGVFVVALDDFVGGDHAAELVVELAPPTGRPDRASGLDLFPIDPAFTLPLRPLPLNGWTVLISFGGSDPTGHTNIALDALDLLDSEHPGLVRNALVAAGLGNPRATALRARIDAKQRDVWVGHVPSLAPYVDQADVVITAAGNTLLEALAARKCTIAVVTSENQVAAATSLAADGSFVYAGMQCEATAEMLMSAMVGMPERLNAGMRNALVRCPVDTLGAVRLVAVIKESWVNR